MDVFKKFEMRLKIERLWYLIKTPFRHMTTIILVCTHPIRVYRWFIVRMNMEKKYLDEEKRFYQEYGNPYENWYEVYFPVCTEKSINAVRIYNMYNEMVEKHDKKVKQMEDIYLGNTLLHKWLCEH